MRRMILSAVLVSVLAGYSLHAQDNDKPRIKGSGKVVTREVSIQSFEQLAVSGVFSVQLSQGSKEEVKIEADDNLQDYFEIKNDGTQLTISMKKDLNYDTKSKMKVYVTFKKLKAMNLKMIGNLSSESVLTFEDIRIENKSVGAVDLKLTARSVTVENKSVGDVTFSGKADEAVIRSNSVGSINASHFVVQKMDIDNTGVGSATVNAEKEIKVKDSFLGKVTNRGAAPIRKMNKVSI